MATLDPSQLNEAGVTLCQCGRIADKRHCCKCGSYVVYHIASKKAVRAVAGAMQEFDVFRCRRCGTLFDDWQWQHECHAPINVTKATVKQRRADADNEAVLTNPQALAAINYIRKRKGEPLIDSTGREIEPNVVEAKKVPGITRITTIDCIECRCGGTQDCICLCHVINEVTK